MDIAAGSRLQEAVLCQRFLSLRKQFPWVYGIFVVNLMGLNFAIVPADYDGFDPTLLFLAIIAARLIHWVRLGKRPVDDASLQRLLFKSYAVAGFVCASFCIWVIFLYTQYGAEHPASIIIFASLTGVGVFYGLSNFPAAARTPIYFLNLPLALLFMTSGDHRQVAIGFAQSFLILLMLRMLIVQDRAFVRLVRTRFEIDAQRQDAVQSERTTLEDHARVTALADTDSLTGLLNRRGLMKAPHSFARPAAPTAMAIFDLDGFKPINDTFGHLAGDELLIEVGARLGAEIGQRGFAARLGGDEFALFFPSPSLEAATTLAERAIRSISRPYTIHARKMSISACAGVSWRTTVSVADLMREADIALYSSKRRGRGSVLGFSAGMQDDIQRRTKIEQALQQPGLIDMIDLAYQPIFHLQSLELRAFEALARWKHSELGWISPAEFIPLTERLGAIEQLSESLLRRSASAALSWPASVKLSFNLSPIQLCTVNSGERLLAIIDEIGFPAERLQVEVTETALLADFSVARDNLGLLRQAGTSIVLDDFGAGFASISYLREISFDAVKLDGSLITAVAHGGPAVPLLRGVLALCEAMGRPCIAEHIETDAQLGILRRLGCRYGQGFGLACPMSEAAATELAEAKVIDIALFRPTVLRAQ